MKKRIYFLGYVVPETIDNNHAFSNISNNMQLGFIEAWSEIDYIVNSYTYYPIPSFSKSKKLIINSSEVDLNISENVSNKRLFFVNLILIKQLFIFVQTFFILLFDIDKNKNNYIVTFNSNYFYTIPAYIVSKITKTKLICFVADAPIDHVKRTNRLLELLRRIDNYTRKKLIKLYDGYLTINENIIKDYCEEKPFEKIYVGSSPSKDVKVFEKKLNKPIKIVYTGSISDYYNINLLIDTMTILGDLYELNLYGKLNMELLNIKHFDNIIYHGSVTPKQAQQAQYESHILISLLKRDSYLGNYAFPGKIFEYSLSEVPIITTDLDSIPYSMKENMSILLEETPNKLAELIRNMTANESIYYEHLKKAKEAKIKALYYSSFEIQVKRISDIFEK